MGGKMGSADHLIQMMEGYSKALYSSFYLFKNYDLLFDCGEGCAARLDRHQFRARWIAISHYHHDHTGGLKGLFLARAYTKGSNDRPLTVFYPESSPSLSRQRAWLKKELPRLPFRLDWIGVREGFAFQLNDPESRIPLELHALRADHSVREQCVAYKIVEKRRRLRTELAHLPENEIAAMARGTSRDELTESYEKNILVYSGDSEPLAADSISDADLLLHDATFLMEEDREEQGHASVEQVLTLGTEAAVKGIVLCHISHRYSLRSVRRRVPYLVRKRGFPGTVWVQWLDRLECVYRNRS
jgi:ribonuclease Z